MALRNYLVLVLLSITTQVFSYDLSGIRVSGNKFVNNAGQEIILRVST